LDIQHPFFLRQVLWGMHWTQRCSIFHSWHVDLVDLYSSNPVTVTSVLVPSRDSAARHLFCTRRLQRHTCWAQSLAVTSMPMPSRDTAARHLLVLHSPCVGGGPVLTFANKVCLYSLREFCKREWLVVDVVDGWKSVLKFCSPPPPKKKSGCFGLFFPTSHWQQGIPKTMRHQFWDAVSRVCICIVHFDSFCCIKHLLFSYLEIFCLLLLKIITWTPHSTLGTEAYEPGTKAASSPL
jgi:hypothetical protein